MDRSRMLKAAVVAVLSVLVGILASTGNEAVLVNLLVVLTGVIVMCKQNQKRPGAMGNKNSVEREPVIANTDHKFDIGRDTKTCDNIEPVKSYNVTCSMCKGNIVVNTLEVETEASSKTKSNVQTQPEVTYPQVPSTSKENEEVAASAPEKACSSCKELPDNSNILVGRMKEAAAKCEDAPEPATAVTGFYFGTSNVYQPCDKCRQRVRKEEVSNIFGCDHSICIYCIGSNIRYFTTSQAPGFLSCPICHRPDIFESKTFGLAYLSTLIISVEKILNQYEYQKFKEVLQKVVTFLESIEQVPVTKNSKRTMNKHLDEKNVYSESREAQTKETLSNRKKKQSKGKNAYLDNSEVQKKENFSKMESKQPKELPEKLMLEAQLSGTEGSAGTTADNDKDWPKLGSRLNKNSTDFPILGSDSSCSFCGTKPDSKSYADAKPNERENCNQLQRTCLHNKTPVTPNSGYKEPPALYDCEMCLKKFGESELVGMPSCEHRFCTTCTFSYFNLEIEERDILACYCPFCVKGEDAKSKEKLFEYFTKLGQILKPHIYSYTFRKFEKKLEELRYTDLCIKCYSPVKAPGKYSRFVDCEYCSTKACTKCRLLWDNVHYTKSCDQYERALRDIPCHAHNMSIQPIDCVSCGERFLHIRDGTIVFSCPKCEAQMCRSCKSPFHLGVECPEGKDKCCLLFFHAHHPANCLFYLQHKKVDDLFRFLRDHNLKPERTNKNSYLCEVEVKKVLRGRTTFEKCGEVLHHNYLGLCKKHAVEFLASIIFKNSLDTKSLLDKNDKKVFIKRGRKDGLQKEFDGATRWIDENELQLKASPSSWNNSDTQSSSLESFSEKTPISMEVVTEASSKTESNVQTQPEVTYPQVTSTSKENEDVAASAPVKACSDCKELPDNSNILVGRMKEADAKCENGPEPATAVSSYYFGPFNVNQSCDMCFQRVLKEKMTKIFGCDHNICVYCTGSNFKYFTISESPKYLSCPKCHRPDIFESKTFGLAYLTALRISVEKILTEYQYQKFIEVLQKVVTFLESMEETSDSTNNNFENGGANPGSSSNETESAMDATEMEVCD